MRRESGGAGASESDCTAPAVRPQRRAGGESLIIVVPVASRNWKDDLPTLILAIAAQFGLVRAVDWARAHTETSDLARRLVEERFYFAPYVGSVLVVLILVRLMVKALNLRGIAIGEWLRSSLLVVMVGVGFLVAAHLDQILERARAPRAPARASGRVARSRRLAVLPAPRADRHAALRDRPRGAPRLPLRDPPRAAAASAEVSAAHGFQSGKDWVRAGDAYLKAGDAKRARRMFKKARAWPRLAALEQRDGKHREAARLYEEAGDAYAWEASRAWEAAGENVGRGGLRQEGASHRADGHALGPARGDRRGSRRSRVSRRGLPAPRRRRRRRGR